MPTTGVSPDLNQVFDEWFAITVKVLKVKIAKLNIMDTGKLFGSVDFSVSGTRGDLFYNLYGKFVDMGVGREFSKGNSGSINSSRQRKEWYSRLFYAQVMRLREVLQTKFGKDAADMIVRQIESVKDLKYSAYKA